MFSHDLRRFLLSFLIPSQVGPVVSCFNVRYLLGGGNLGAAYDAPLGLTIFCQILLTLLFTVNTINQWAALTIPLCIRMNCLLRLGEAKSADLLKASLKKGYLFSL